MAGILAADDFAIVPAGISHNTQIIDSEGAMARQGLSASVAGIWLIIAAALCGLAVSIFNYFDPQSGIAGEPGTILVIVSTTLLALFGWLLVANKLGGAFLRGFIALAALLDIAGTGFAGYMLHSWSLVALMIIGLAGWLFYILSPSPVTMRVFLAFLGLFALAVSPTPNARAEEPAWSTFNGDLAAQKYSPLTQITPENVGRLTVAWRTHTGDVSSGGPPPSHLPMRPDLQKTADLPPTVWSATPLFVNDTVYLGTPFYRIFALEPDTGKVKWVYDTKSTLEALTQPDLKNRGVSYWQADAPVAGQACQKRVYIGTMDARLHAVDADTGAACADFGSGGVVDINQWNTENAKWPLSLLQPPTVFEDYLFVGWAGKDWAESQDSPGTVYALDARTGALRWTFHALPPEIAPKTGTANVWASMSVDRERRILYVPVSSPSPNFFGGAYPNDLPIVTSVTALDISTGKTIWSRQLVHHDIWDLDTNAAPTLVDIDKDGRTIPALVQTSKQGFLYVLDRTTGEPVYPIEERPVPASTIPGEHASPSQPYVAVPEPVIPDEWPGLFDLADYASLGYCSRVLKTLRYEGRFTPPSLEGSLIYPATIGGTEWGGGAVDPNTQIFVVNSSSAVQIYQLLARADYDKAASGGSETGGLFPMSGGPYGINLTTFLNPIGMPCWKPPYGTIAAYDLKTGERLWNRPFGQIQKWGFYMPESWGTITIGGPAITASGLIFIGASMDSMVRALDLKTGEVLWKALVSAPAVALPAIYQYKGKQYVVFTAGGNSILAPKVSDEIVAFSLPD